MNDNAIIRQSVNMTEMAASMVAEMSGKIARLFTKEQVKNISKVIITGCGDSYIAGLAAEQAFKKFSGMGVFPMNTVDATYNIMPRTVKGSTWDTLAIGISVSGTAGGTVKSMINLKKLGAITLGITENVNSPLAKKVDYILNHPHAESEVCPGTKTYFSSVITLMLVAIHFGQLKGKLTCEQAEAARQEIVEYALSWKPWLEKIDTQVKELAYMPCFKDAKHFECAGSGADYVAAWFTRAKIYEAIGTPTTVENTEDWLHVNYFIRKPKENPCIVFATKGSSGETRTITSSKTAGRAVKVCSFTICLSCTPKRAASFGGRWIWRCAAITPSPICMLPQGPVRVQPGLHLTSPDSLTGGLMPRVRPSVREISTCASFRSGPSTATF